MRIAPLAALRQARRRRAWRELSGEDAAAEAEQLQAAAADHQRAAGLIYEARQQIEEVAEASSDRRRRRWLLKASAALKRYEIRISMIGSDLELQRLDLRQIQRDLGHERRWRRSGS